MAVITLAPMTKDLANKIYNGFENDPIACENESFKPFVYSEGFVDEYLKKQENLKHVLFAIMLEDKPIGEVKLHNISTRRKQCQLAVTLKNDCYKNKGYGTEAIKQALIYAQENLDMRLVEARTLLKNVRSQRALKKAGFIETFRAFNDVYFEKELDKDYTIKPIKIVPMTRELYHEFYRGYIADLPPKGYRYRYTEYIYDEESEDLCYRLGKALGRHIFAIMIDDIPRGIVHLQNVNNEEDYCYIECKMQSKDFKNRTYGTQSIIKVLQYVKRKLGISTVRASVSQNNTHAIHVLEKIGFSLKLKDGSKMLYEINV